MGITNTYFYGIGEAKTKGIDIESQRPAWQTVHNNGGKVCTDGHDYGKLRTVADILDSGNTANGV